MVFARQGLFHAGTGKLGINSITPFSDDVVPSGLFGNKCALLVTLLGVLLTSLQFRNLYLYNQ